MFLPIIVNGSVNPKLLYERNIPLDVPIEHNQLKQFLEDIGFNQEFPLTEDELKKWLYSTRMIQANTSHDWQLHPMLEDIIIKMKKDFHQFIANGARKNWEFRSGHFFTEKDIEHYWNQLIDIQNYNVQDWTIKTLWQTYKERSPYKITRLEASENTINHAIAKMRNRFKPIIFQYFKIFEDSDILDELFLLHAWLGFNGQEKELPTGCQTVHNILNLTVKVDKERLAIRNEFFKLIYWMKLFDEESLYPTNRKKMIMLSERILKFHIKNQYPRSHEYINRIMPEFPIIETYTAYNKKVKNINEMEY